MSVPWEWVNRARLIVQAVLAIAIEVFDNLPSHEYEKGAEIGLGLLLLTTAEIVIRRYLAGRSAPSSS